MDKKHLGTKPKQSNFPRIRPTKTRSTIRKRRHPTTKKRFQKPPQKHRKKKKRKKTFTIKNKKPTTITRRIL